MLVFPRSTEFNKRIPKQKFYENMDVSPALKRVFVEQIKLIYWRNKLSPATMNVASGETVSEIQVIEIKLLQPLLEESVLRQIDREIPYHILFLLTFEDKVQAWTGYKEATETGNNAFRVNHYYHTDWMLQSELSIELKGLNMDALWESFVTQVGGIKLDPGRSLDEQIQLNAQRTKLQKEIEQLEKKAWSEKQPSKKFQLAQQVKKLKKEMLS